MTDQGDWKCNDKFCDVWGPRPIIFDTAARFGWWGIGTQGSLNKIGEYQDLRSSQFWNLDGIASDGRHTLDFTLSGLDNQANSARAAYYGSAGSVKLRFDDYLRRLDHDPLVGFPRPTFPAQPGPNDNVVVEDLNVGEDYAIRVAQLDVRFQGRISDHLKWRLNLWGLRKFGERQVNATAHCFNVNAPAAAGANGNVCHVLSERQSIDWLTAEIQPVVEAQFDNWSVEYSRTMRGFGQSDQLVDRQYTRFNFQLPSASGFLGPQYLFAFVPENYTQIDRVKARAVLTEDKQVYANIFVGDTHNDFRDTHRQFGGYDLRLIDRSLEQLTSTFYVNNYDENNQLPTTFFTAPPFSSPDTYDQDSLKHPVDYSHTRAGWRGTWRPSSDPTNGFSLISGYEYYQLARDYATYDTALGPFTQQDTKTNMLEIGPQMRWSPTRTTYVRYKVRFIEDPLIGVRANNGRFDTNQPQQDHRVELGETWTPDPKFMATGQISFVNSWNHSEFANFDETSYPIVLTAWYAPTTRLSFSGGYSYFTNWIDQDITLGFTTPNVPVPPLRTETSPWGYAGKTHVLSFNGNYALTSTVSVLGGYEFCRGSNVFSVAPSPAGADWSVLPFLSDVLVETQRLTAGADWRPTQNFSVFARYIFFDWNNLASNIDSGTAHMGLAGASLIW